MTDDYFAGLVDGEGSIRIARQSRGYHLRVQMTLTDRRPLDALRARFGGSVYAWDPADGRRRPWYQWVVTSSRAAAALEALLPHLMVKQAQAYLGLEFQSLLDGSEPRLSPRKVSMFEQMKELNRRGPR